MKKVLSIVAIASLAIATVACGPSKAELEAKEKAKQDSMTAAMQADSAKVAAEAAVAQAKADSLKAEETKAAEAAALVAHEDSVKKKLIKAKK
jgi:hypothetical protein